MLPYTLTLIMGRAERGPKSPVPGPVLVEPGSPPVPFPYPLPCLKVRPHIGSPILVGPPSDPETSHADPCLPPNLGALRCVGDLSSLGILLEAEPSSPSPAFS